jgi:pectin methylesterase-like acyl-CoA thioesterase
MIDLICPSQNATFEVVEILIAMSLLQIANYIAASSTASAVYYDSFVF